MAGYTMKLFTSGMILCLWYGRALAVENEGDNPLDWLRNSIPGEPGVDYPIYSSVQQTAFTCDGLIFGGYYADPEMECQAYHVCLQDPLSPETLYPVSFLCPNGTVFNQELFNCDWWYNVDCSQSASLYGLAEGAFGTQGGSGDDGGAGSCPAAQPLSPDQCAGSVSTCWSPGQRDTDCPNNGLCCFDGCANTCGEKPQQQSAAQPQATIVKTTTPGYNYDVPEVTLPVRPQTTPRPTPTTTEPLALYGPPAREGRAFRNNRKNRRQGRRVSHRRRPTNYHFV